MLEQFDVLGRDGLPTGAIAQKGDPLSDGQYFLGVHGYIHNAAGDFLLQRRALDKEFLPGGWEIHMGHVMSGESGAQAMVREIEEEIGLRVDERELNKVARIVRDEQHHIIDVFFIERALSLRDLVLQPEEVIGVKWVGLDEMIEIVEGMDYRPEAYRAAVMEVLAAMKGRSV